MPKRPELPSRIAAVQKAIPPSYRLVELLVYSRQRDAVCSLCWHPSYLWFVELSYRRSTGNYVVRWTSRWACRDCIAILSERAEGKITHCPF